MTPPRMSGIVSPISGGSSAGGVNGPWGGYGRTMLIHQMHLLAGADPVLAAGVLGTIGKAIFWIFAVVFIAGALVGLLVGFFVGRTIGRNQSPAGQKDDAGSDAGQLTG